MPHSTAVDPAVADPFTVPAQWRRGEVVEVIRNGDREQYRIRWEDGQESLYRPGTGTPPA
ncbi:protein of unknown function [Pseudonocardia thermophila]|jgi:Domain of unknown function (DUF1918).|uniref:DUF1918 domain-containing protein n=1 Tax=Pseudonocardia thermophila TaxID=1848 RepID=A0A1M6V3W9_PSETH|nr:DUF1918 domain-containing protein [Pseudonocardia thermophila]SHK76094.1 protein of unknown function [Pseudonocardia thermophila]